MSRLSPIMRKTRGIDIRDILPHLFKILKKGDIRTMIEMKLNEILGKGEIATYHMFGWILSLPMRN